MRGKAGVPVRTARLEALRPSRLPRRVSPWNLDALSDADLEALLPLAEKQAAAQEAGAAPAWTAEELDLMGRLWVKQAGTER